METLRQHPGDNVMPPPGIRPFQHPTTEAAFNRYPLFISKQMSGGDSHARVPLTVVQAMERPRSTQIRHAPIAHNTL